jgi:hypothetical protein
MREAGLIPLWLQLLASLAAAVIVVVYARRYPLSNFLWFSNIGMLGTVLALWLESSLLASMMAVGGLLPALAWNLSFFWQLISGRGLAGLTNYMFDPGLPRYLRALSLYHVFMPLLLVWLVLRLGYDPWALPAQTLLMWAVLVLTWWVRPVDNVNFVRGPARQAQTSLHPLLHLGMVMLAAPLLLCVPTHFLLLALSG